MRRSGEPVRAGDGAARALVLGGTGFVGRQVCARLAALGHDVLAVGRTRPPWTGQAVRFTALDLAAAGTEALVALLRAHRPTVVVNAAGGVWNVDAEQMTRSNVTLVEQLIAALDAWEGRPRLIHLGSAHEYGPVPYGSLVDEATLPRPQTNYGRTKLRGTTCVLEAARAGVVDGIVLRVSNVIGPNAPATSLPGVTVARLRAAAAQGRTAVLRTGPARVFRDFVDVCDVADGVAAAAGRGGLGVINLGGGTAVDVRGLMEQLARISGAAARVVVEDHPDGRIVRASGDWQLLDISAAAQRLGWAPRRGLTDSLRSLWESTQSQVRTP
ncbi:MULTISPECIES: NAD(P)-dependent oxidoreductase [unclassified Streptomyces]|uniref:NAD-dependent epimerase/dehydratase family protein n=1 Tax=unclassified Streptomyces TaxID=2593676 RepID=UPI00332341F8